MSDRSLRINGQVHTVRSDVDTPLLYVLTDELQLKGPRFGCGMAQCGSCSVLVDGVETRSCVTPLSAVQGRQVTTLEGLPAWHARRKGREPGAELHPLQAAMVDLQSPQCGYCYNGMVIKGAELLARQAAPKEQDVRDALAGHLCRCGTYQEITQAVLQAAAAMRRGA
jgi:aerobic-type carbon monoxide dehydrogenase small subunit (CoxS/CutS family)